MTGNHTPHPASDTSRELTAIKATLEQLASFADTHKEVSDAMVGHEALRQAAHNTHAKQLNAAQADMDLIEAFANAILPAAIDSWRLKHFALPGDGEPEIFCSWRRTGTTFEPATYLEANALQAQTLWSRLPKNEWGGEGGVDIQRNMTKKYKRQRAPLFMVGERKLEGQQSEAMLVSPIRRQYNPSLLAIKAFRAGSRPYQQFTTRGPVLYVARMRTKTLGQLEEQISSRQVQYVNRAEKAEELPIELERAITSQRWPHPKDKTQEIGANLTNMRKPTHIRSLNAADLVSDYPITHFNVPKRLAALALILDKREDFSELIEAHIAKTS